MAEFSKCDLTGDAPEGICPKCWTNGGVLHEPTDTAIVYCEHRMRGAYRIRSRPWKVIAGIERAIFIADMTRGLTMGELVTDLQRDLAALLKKQAADATKH